MRSESLTFLKGWRLVGVLSRALIAMALGIAAWHHFDVEGARMVIRVTARTSLVLFCLAFSASVLLRVWPNGWTRWQRQNRRYLGVSFAVSHTIHAIAIVWFAVLAPAQFRQSVDPVTIIFGSIGYAFIFAMTATSFDKTAALLGSKRWRTLHTVGSYYIWFIFMISEGPRVVTGAFYWPFAALLLFAMGARLGTRLVSRDTRGAQAGARIQ